MMSALCVIIMALGAAISIGDMASAMASSFLILFICIEFSLFHGFGTFLAAGILSFILLPTQTPFFYFALLYGWYPILKYCIEKRVKRRLPRFAIKFGICFVASVIEETLARMLLGYTKSTLIMVFYIVIQCVIYLLYDKCLDVLAINYVYKWRKHLFRSK